MSNEELIYTALSTVTEACHLVLDGRPQRAATYRKSGERNVYESDTLLYTEEQFEVLVCQIDYDEQLIADVCAALEDAGFAVRHVGQTMADEYYTDELRAAKQKTEG